MNDSKQKQPEQRINGLTYRQVCFMQVCYEFGRVSRKHFEQLCLHGVPAKSRPRVARRTKATLIRRSFFKEHSPPGVIGQPEKLVSLSQRGLEWYDATFSNPVAMAKPINFPQPFHQNHTLQLVETHILVKRAAKQLAGLKLHRWIIEHETVNYWEPDRKKQHTLRLQLEESPPLVVDPDAFFHVSFNGIDGLFAVEEDCMTIAAERVARSKSKGYAGLDESKRHRQFFPESKAKSFRVLLIVPKVSRRDRLCDTLAAYNIRPDLWRVASKTELTADNFFTGEVWRTHDKQPVSLLPKSSSPTPAVASPSPQMLAMAATTSTQTGVVS